MSAVKLYMLIFLTALVVAAGSTPLLRRLAPRLGFMDQPSARKLHSVPIPRLGGVAIYLAFVIALLAFEDRYNISQLLSIVLGATLASSLGLWDDRRPLPPWLKLIGQTIAAGILIIADVRISLFPWSTLNVLATLFWVVGITNALNLMDNMDGLAAGVAAIAAGFFLLLAAGSGQYLVGALAAALLGACIGFLFYNLNPAQIFMGDSGSLFIGFMLAAVGIKLRFPQNITAVTWMIPVLVLGLPIFDTGLVIISRLRRGVNPLSTPGKDHLSHRLVARGMTHREAVLTLYLAGGLLGALAMFIVNADKVESYIIGAAVAGIALYFLRELEWMAPAGTPARGESAHERQPHQ
ncbi:MAG: glycosyltransferase family 4 protein [Anaerolineae bacterium]